MVRAADVVVMIGAAPNDAAERHVAVEGRAAAYGEADRLRQLKAAGDIERVVRGAGRVQDFRGAPGHAVDDVAVIGCAHDQNARAGDMRGGGQGRVSRTP